MTKCALLLAFVACTLVVVITAVLLTRDNRLRAKPRRQWKDQAITTIEARMRDAQSLQADINRLASRAASSRSTWGAWVGEDVLVMKNNDWIVCRNICSKEDARVHDLFIGHGSDGKWYYSTFHFCKGK